MKQRNDYDHSEENLSAACGLADDDIEMVLKMAEHSATPSAFVEAVERAVADDPGFVRAVAAYTADAIAGRLAEKASLIDRAASAMADSMLRGDGTAMDNVRMIAELVKDREAHDAAKNGELEQASDEIGLWPDEEEEMNAALEQAYMDGYSEACRLWSSKLEHDCASCEIVEFCALPKAIEYKASRAN